MRAGFLVILSFLFAGKTAHAQFKDTLSISEVTISAKTTVKVTGDTISFTVDSFIKNPLANAEDVLKKLPGVEVGQDGKITMQGKEVVKIFINGKEYNAEDIRTITQNLPAEALEKIQVADWYDEEAQFSGIRKGSQQKSINLKFKKQYEQGLYGRVGAGYGTKQRYQGGLFANLMGNDARLTAIGNINNTGIADATTEQDNTTQSGMNLPGQTSKQKLNLNFSYDKIKNLKLSGTYEISDNKTQQQQYSARTTWLPGDSLLLRHQASQQNNNNQSNRLNLRAHYKFSEKLNSITELGGNINSRSSSSNADDSTSSSENSSSQNPYSNGLQPDFTRNSVNTNKSMSWGMHATERLQKRFRKKGRSLGLNLSARYNADDRKGRTENSNLYFDPFTANNTVFNTTDRRDNLNTRVNLQYSEPISKASSLSATYSNAYTRSRNDKDVTDKAGDYDSVQSRYTRNMNAENSFGLTYQYQTEKLTAGAGADATQYNRVTNDQRLITNYSQHGVNYFPNAFSKYKLSKYADINLNYNGSIISPELRQVQPVPDYTDSLNIFIGNPGLRPELNNRTMGRYNYFNSTTQRMFWVSFGASWTNRKIINKTELSSSRRITTPVNRDGVYSLDGSANYTQPVISKKLKASIGVQGNLANNISITNGLLQQVQNYSYTPSAKLVLNATSRFEGDLGYSYNYSHASAASGPNTQLQVHRLNSSGTFFFPSNIKFSYHLSYVHNNVLAVVGQKDFLLLNATLDKSFLKPKGLSLRLQGFDVLNRYPNYSRSFGDNYFEDRTLSRVGSYFMFSVLYKFTYFPKKNN